MTISPTAPVVAYDILTMTPVDDFLSIPLILTTVGAVMVIFPGLLNPNPASYTRRVFSWFYFVFAAFVSLLTLASYYGNYAVLRAVRLSGDYRTVAGCLEAFHPMPEAGHDDERLMVGGQTFAYSDYTLTAAFRQSESHGGPIHRDSWVRIAYVDDLIIRLEVADHACPPATADLPPLD